MISQNTHWTAGRIRLALARHFDWFHNRMYPEWFIDGGVADLVFVSKAGYVTEIEVKISVSDWKADQWKRKWDIERPHITRFFYAVPDTLVDSIPDNTPDFAGILSISAGRRTRDDVREIRAAMRRPSIKLTPAAQQKMFESAYYRYWNREIHRLHFEIFDRPKIREIQRKARSE